MADGIYTRPWAWVGEINDSSPSTTTTYSGTKVEAELDLKQDAVTWAVENNIVIFWPTNELVDSWKKTSEFAPAWHLHSAVDVALDTTNFWGSLDVTVVNLQLLADFIDDNISLWASILFGLVNPTTEWVEGDVYINNSSWDVFYKTWSWVLKWNIEWAQWIQGIQGVQWVQWVQGIQWDQWFSVYSWNSVPSSWLGVNWDGYINTSSWVTYQKTWWSWVVDWWDLTWPAWPQGIQGIQWIQWLDGPPWISWGVWSDWVFAYDFHTSWVWQTIFNLTYTYTSGENNLYVYVNGNKQVATVDYTETSDTSVTFTTWLTLNDTVEFINPNKGMNWKWAFNFLTAYKKDDAVHYNWSAYICILASTSNLPTDITYWDVLANKWTTWVNTWTVTSTSWQTIFTVWNYTLWTDLLGIEVNGLWQIETTDYTETSTTSITFTSWLTTGDVVKWKIFS